jgi:hypothetical protein
VRTCGVTYDTGLTTEGRSTRRTFSSDVARRELQIIAADLHATAARVYGDDPGRLTAAAGHALDAGLDVWFSPIPVDLTPVELVAYLADRADDAERLRRRAGAGDGTEVVLVLGCELSLFCRGFVPGDTWADRIATMTDPATWADPDRLAAMQRGLDRWHQVHRDVAAAARARFGGRLTYAAGLWEDVPWELYDVVSVDAYRDAANAATFRETLSGLRRFGRPVAVTEFGCCTYRGAGDRGGSGWRIVDRSVEPPVIDGDHVRDEGEQVRYLHELLDEFDAAQLEAAFWFSFAGYELPHRPGDPRHDLDLAAYGLVATLDGAYGRAYPDLTWEPKQAFGAMAEAYAVRTAVRR